MRTIDFLKVFKSLKAVANLKFVFKKKKIAKAIFIIAAIAGIVGTGERFYSAYFKSTIVSVKKELATKYISNYQDLIFGEQDIESKMHDLDMKFVLSNISKENIVNVSVKFYRAILVGKRLEQVHPFHPSPELKGIGPFTANIDDDGYSCNHTLVW